MPEDIYSNQEIEQFVRQNLEVSSAGWLSDPSNSGQRILVDAISNMPPEFQVFAMETNLDVTISTPNNFGAEALATGITNSSLTAYSGSGYSGTMSVQNGETNPDRTIALNSLYPSGYSQDIYGHEFGHRADYEIDNTPNRFFSDNPSWQQAYSEQFPSLPNQLNVFGSAYYRLTSLVVKSDFEGWKSIQSHLAQYTGEMEHHRPAEALAEVTKGYLHLYKEFDGNEAAVNAALTDKYPKLWPVYRDEFLPSLQQHVAEKFPERFTAENYEKRQNAFHFDDATRLNGERIALSSVKVNGMGVGMGIMGLSTRFNQTGSDMEAGLFQGAASVIGSSADVADVAIGAAGMADDLGTKIVNGASKLSYKVAAPLAVGSTAAEMIAAQIAGDQERFHKAGASFLGAGAGLKYGAAGGTMVCGPWCGAAGGVIGAITGGIIGEEAVEAIYHGLPSISAMRDEMIQERWQEYGISAVDKIILEIPYGEGIELISSSKLRHVAEAKTELMKLLKNRPQIIDDKYKVQVEEAANKLTEAAFHHVDRYLNDNYREDQLNSVIHTEMFYAADDVAILTNTDIRDVQRESQTISEALEKITDWNNHREHDFPAVASDLQTQRTQDTTNNFKPV
jgi:hypothetical protein